MRFFLECANGRAEIPKENSGKKNSGGNSGTKFGTFFGNDFKPQTSEDLSNNTVNKQKPYVRRNKPDQTDHMPGMLSGGLRNRTWGVSNPSMPGSTSSHTYSQTRHVEKSLIGNCAGTNWL